MKDFRTELIFEHFLMNKAFMIKKFPGIDDAEMERRAICVTAVVFDKKAAEIRQILEARFGYPIDTTKTV